MLGSRSRGNDTQPRLELVEHGPPPHRKAKVEIQKKLAAPAADASGNLGDRHLVELAVSGHQSLEGLQRYVGVGVIDDGLYQAEIQMRKEEVRDSALKNDNTDAVALRGQPAHELVELGEQGRIHQVDRIVVYRHPGDSTLDANVEGPKIRNAHC